MDGCKDGEEGRYLNFKTSSLTEKYPLKNL